ncbi:Rad21/Rec8-like protein N-terminal [Arabidopsis thaliana x Arabidopsis arenosa]|uniref:Rad21/Rec8-like protein N-terminal n=1 Tax=Arabidopsis thaliana x Arabidopsis arenosa TaxID=1240361 RepID=A0A8T1Z2H8_9BRAS|nr:Rad21/Rec8-like protein N-terminal [Arabidopsis thaliana x Arabidopsis arenosa]
MFNPHNKSFLLKKSVKTAWCAAHVHNLLEKSQYIATNIPKTVDNILLHEVPMSIRMSEDLRQAQFHLITLPQTLNLDELDLEDDDTLYMEFENHIGNEEDITLSDQIPTGIDPYVTITFDDEDIIPESIPMDIEIEKRRDAARDLSPASHSPFAAQQQNIRVESLHEILNDKEATFHNIDEEVLNSRGHSTFELRLGSPSFAGSEEERAEFVHPSPEMVLQPTTPPTPQTRPRKRKHYYDNEAVLLSHKILRKRSEDPSKTVRKRKKLPSSKLGFWRLDNQSKKDQLFNEPLFTGFSNVLRSVFEKDCVASKPYLAVPDETIPEPASSPTREAETEINPASPVSDFINPDSTVQRSPRQETEDVQGVAGPQSASAESVAAEAQSPQPSNNDDIEIEHFRDGGFHNYMPSPPPRSSPFRTNDFTTQPETWETRSYRTETSTSTNLENLPGLNIPEYMPSPPLRSSPFRTNDFTTQPESLETGSYRTEPSTSTIPESSSPGLKTPGLPTNPERMDEELQFLEEGGNNSVRSPITQDSDAFPGRTRAVAQYLKERCSSSLTSSSHASGDLSLNKILEGKTRKIAARMFYETLVLKSRGLIDMKQDQPYSDISLKLMPALFSKTQL